MTANDHVFEDRATLRLCTAGSVDDGKSTFVGRLLHDTKSVLADQLAAVEHTSAQRGFSGLDLSLLVDGLRAEREQGITIDVAYRYFATPACPPHRSWCCWWMRETGWWSKPCVT